MNNNRKKQLLQARIETLTEEINKLREERAELKYKLNYMNNYEPTSEGFKNSKSMLLFGKRLKDLTEDEKREYNRIRKRENREKKRAL